MKERKSFKNSYNAMEQNLHEIFMISNVEYERSHVYLIKKINKGALIAGNKINGYSRRLHWPWTCCYPRWAITIQESL